MYDVVFYDDVGGAISPAVALKQGMAGAEHQVMLAAQGLSAAGRKVLVISRLKRWGFENEYNERIAFVDIQEYQEICVKVLVIHAYSSIPAWIEADKTFVLSKDLPGGNHSDHLSNGLTVGGWTHIAPSKWASDEYGKLYPNWKTRIVIPYMIQDHVYTFPKVPKDPNKFIYASAALKGLTRTLEEWCGIPRVSHAMLYVCVPGYDAPSNKDKTLFDSENIKFLGSLTPEKVIEEMRTAAGMFYVNVFPETFCVSAVLAETLGCRMHILCENGFGALKETLTSASVTDDLRTFRAEFVTSCIYDVEGSPPRNFNEHEVVPQWEHALFGETSRRKNETGVYPDIQTLRAAIETNKRAGLCTKDLARIEKRSAAYTDGWGTHLPLLAAVVAIANPGTVLECGCGPTSTPMLAELCKATNREFISLESEEAWIDTNSDICETLHVPRWAGFFDGINKYRTYAVAFIDNHPSEDRLVNLNALADKAEFIVVHDTLHPDYLKGINERLDQFKYRYDYTHMASCTSVVSNVRPYPGSRTLKGCKEKSKMKDAKDLKIAAVMIAGNSSTIETAVRSVTSIVDEFILINTGITDDTSARALAATAGTNIICNAWCAFDWINDFAAARNAALKAATQAGADWALIIDTDEWINTGLDGPVGRLKETLKKKLYEAEKQGHTCVLTPYDNGSYHKVRFIKLPAQSKYVGRTHEVYMSGGASWTDFSFGEHPKTPEQFKVKFERDRKILEEVTKKSPKDQRWWYYLGDTYANLELSDQAVQAFITAGKCDGWDEEGAWAYYRAATILNQKNAPERALKCCQDGLKRHPGIAELAWLASYSCYYLNRFTHAVAYGHIAIALGSFDGCEAELNRTGFRDVYKLWEFPYDALRHAYLKLGRQDLATACELARVNAVAARERKENQGTDGARTGGGGVDTRSELAVALTDARTKSAENGTDGLTTEEINAEIRAWERERDSDESAIEEVRSAARP
jgi:tetratricopeptide (TPR) repeat protein